MDKAITLTINNKRRGKVLKFGFITVPAYDPISRKETRFAIINIRIYIGLYPHDEYTTIHLTTGKIYTTLNQYEMQNLVMKCLNGGL